jgi:hypothetical protein
LINHLWQRLAAGLTLTIELTAAGWTSSETNVPKIAVKSSTTGFFSVRVASAQCHTALQSTLQSLDYFWSFTQYQHGSAGSK